MKIQLSEERLGPEQRLRQDRVYDVGLMTSGLVHELNNMHSLKCNVSRNGKAILRTELRPNAI